MICTKSHFGKALLSASSIWAVSEERVSLWLVHGEDWIILLGEQRLLSELSERRPVTDGHLHCLSWLLSSSISQIHYLHVSLQRNDHSHEEQTANKITATTSPSLSFYFHLSLSLFLPLHFLSVHVWLALMTQNNYQDMNLLPISKTRNGTVPQSITVKGCEHGLAMYLLSKNR